MLSIFDASVEREKRLKSKLVCMDSLLAAEYCTLDVIMKKFLNLYPNARFGLFAVKFLKLANLFGCPKERCNTAV